MQNIIKINDLNLPELDIYARLSEVQLLRYYEPNPGIFIAESPKVIERALNAGYAPLSFLMEEKHIDTEGKDILARCENVPVYTSSFETKVTSTLSLEKLFSVVETTSGTKGFLLSIKKTGFILPCLIPW